MKAEVWLLRHGSTQWAASGRHTGRREIALDASGRREARAAGEVLGGRAFDRVLVSPQKRAVETCRLAGHGARARLCPDLVEWDYGAYEGLTDEQTKQRRPGWDLFRDGCPEGETPEEVSARVRRVISCVCADGGTSLLVSHGKTLRALAAEWIMGDVRLGTALALEPAAVSILAHDLNGPQVRLWGFSPLSLQRAWPPAME